MPNFSGVEAVCDGFGVRSVCRADVPMILRLPVSLSMSVPCSRLGMLSWAALVGGAAECAGSCLCVVSGA